MQFNVSNSICNVLHISILLPLVKRIFGFSAVAVNPKLQYAIVEVQSGSTDSSTLSGNAKKKLGNVFEEYEKLFLIVALDLVPTLEAKWGKKLLIKKKLLGSDLENCRLV